LFTAGTVDPAGVEVPGGMLSHRHVRAMAADVAALPRITNSGQTSPCTTPGAANDRRQSRASVRAAA